MGGYKPTGKHRDKVLTAATVRAITKPGLHADGGNLYLRVQPNGAKYWVQRVTIEGKRRDIGLGATRKVTLADARAISADNLRKIHAGINPLEERKTKAVMSFEEAACALHLINKPHWKNEKHADQWMNTLRHYAFPKFGSKSIAEVTSGDIRDALDLIWFSKPETARRVKQRIGSVFKWAMAKSLRTDNPVDTASIGLRRPDKSKVQHRKALPYSEVALAIAKVRSSEAGPSTKLAFEFLVHTAGRSIEIREAVWSEIDLRKKEWVIPGSRMKAKRQHRVPLSDRAIEILVEAAKYKQADSDLLFPGTKAGRPLSDMTLSKLMKELTIEAVPHGFRSSFRDWAGEATDHAREVVEMALAHVIQNKAEAAYARSDLFEKRKFLMSDWSMYLAKIRGAKPL